jgi:2-keto-3-deoxy-L-rhamnonate aldolase RhmA
MRSEFRGRVRSGEVLLGVFLKTPSHHMVELVGCTGLDFAIADAEHAPFNLETLDRMALAAAACDLPVLVRPVAAERGFVGQVLDLGLDGIVAPHVDSRQAAEGLLDGVRYDRGQRGFSPSTRAGGYGAPDAVAYRQASDGRTSCWCQIEDAAALDRLDDIAAVEAVDCLFIGRADLAHSLGVASPADAKVVAAVQRIAEAGRRAGRTLGIYVSGTGEIAALRTLGISVFVCGSDQSWLIGEGRRIRGEVSVMTGQDRT